MHRAKGDRFVRASELPVCDNDGITTCHFNKSSLCLKQLSNCCSGGGGGGQMVNC